MIRSKKIQLVLLSAALASCNKVFLPLRQSSQNTTDSTLTASNAYNADSLGDKYLPCCQSYAQLWNYSFNPFDFYYVGPIGQNYYIPRTAYRKRAGWKGNQLIVRGGFGNTSIVASISS